MKLRKSGRTEIRRIEKFAEHATKAGAVEATSDVTYEEVEGDLWEDLDGNVYAWTPKGSGVIAIEIKDDKEETAGDRYKKLKEIKQKKLSTEERVALLEQALEVALRKLAELGH